MASPQSKLQRVENKYTETKIRALNERRNQGLFNMLGGKAVFVMSYFFQHIVKK